MTTPLTEAELSDLEALCAAATIKTDTDHSPSCGCAECTEAWKHAYNLAHNRALVVAAVPRLIAELRAAYAALHWEAPRGPASELDIVGLDRDEWKRRAVAAEEAIAARIYAAPRVDLSASEADKERAAEWSYQNGGYCGDDLAEQFAAVRAEERNRCSAICGDLAGMREAGAGESPRGQRLRQAQRMIDKAVGTGRACTHESIGLRGCSTCDPSTFGRVKR